MKCPKCGSISFRRKGFHFDHEYRCPTCCHIWDSSDDECPKCGDKVLVHPPTGQRACRNPECRYLFDNGFLGIENERYS
ncbi:MAG: hypothetical protein ACXAC5_03495 [Promethearchaeota archaeon]|jgi:ssDNA-binding Zn-finger/Zn-ribbon topoisomerase 1